MAIPVAFGTVPQWGSFGALVFLAVLVLRYLPPLILALNQRGQVRNERLRDQAAHAAAEEKTALETWQEIEQRVSRELEECHQAREADAAMRARLDDENFRLRVVLTLVLDEIERLDPTSHITLKAKGILTLPRAGDMTPPDVERVRLDQLLSDLNRREESRR